MHFTRNCGNNGYSGSHCHPYNMQREGQESADREQFVKLATLRIISFYEL